MGRRLREPLQRHRRLHQLPAPEDRQAVRDGLDPDDSRSGLPPSRHRDVAPADPDPDHARLRRGDGGPAWRALRVPGPAAAVSARPDDPPGPRDARSGSGCAVHDAAGAAADRAARRGRERGAGARRTRPGDRRGAGVVGRAAADPGAARERAPGLPRGRRARWRRAHADAAVRHPLRRLGDRRRTVAGGARRGRPPAQRAAARRRPGRAAARLPGRVRRGRRRRCARSSR